MMIMCFCFLFQDPLERWVWGNVVLMGEAAHPTTPHVGRSTNMSIEDAYCLGRHLEAAGPRNIPAALAAYQEERLQLCSQQVLYSRYIGQLRQGHLHPPFSWPFDNPTPEQLWELSTELMDDFDWRTYLAKCKAADAAGDKLWHLATADTFATKRPAPAAAVGVASA